jgi:protein-disulfide isomerase
MSSTGEPRATRKERREEAREARKSLEAQESQRQLRRRRMMQLGGAGLVAVVVIGVAFAVSSGSSSNAPPKEGSNKANEAQKLVSSEVSGIPQSGTVLGDPKAPVTLVYFGDLECPICRQFTLGALPSVIANQVRQGKAKVEYRSMQTATREPAVFREQQAAALAAGRQNLMWQYLELFYHEQGEEDSGYVTPTYLKGLAKQVPGLNLAKWETERTDPKLVEQVEKDETTAGEQGFNGTPSFLVIKHGGTTQKLSEFTTAQLNEAAALFEPTIERVAKS